MRVCTRCETEETKVIPALGHEYSTEWTVDKEPDCTHTGLQSHHCIRCDAKQNVTEIPAKGHSYGEWEIITEPTPFEEGERQRTCSVCGFIEKEVLDKIQGEDSEYATVHFRVVNAQTLDPLGNINLSVVKDGKELCTLVTDEEGKVTQRLPYGYLSVAVYGSQYKMRNLNININESEMTLPDIGISASDLVRGELTYREMTREEIIAAGIDITAEENNHVYKYEAKLTFRPEIDVETITYFFNDLGQYLGGCWGSYEPSEGEVPPTSTVGKGSGEGHGIYYQLGIGAGGEPGCGIGIKYTNAEGEEEEATVYPIAEKFFLIIHGEVKWLKEMYEVELLIMNDSMTDTIQNCKATLELPEGLSFAAMNDYVQTAEQTVDFIDKGGSHSILWYVRGDEAGAYNLKATLEGILVPDNDSSVTEPFFYEYTAKSPIKVYAGTDMHLTFNIPDTAYYGEDYHVEIILENVSDHVIYGVKHEVTEVISQHVVYYSDGSEELLENIKYPGDLIYVNEFKPGDKLIIDVVKNINWKSVLIEKQKESLKEKISSFETFYNGYKAVETGLNLAKSLGSFLSSASSNIDKIISASSSGEMRSAASKLSTSVRKLMSKVSKGDSDAIKTLDKLKGMGIYDEIMKIADDPTFFQMHQASEILALSQKLDTAEKAADTEDATIFDVINTAIDLIPEKFVLESAVISSMEGTTCEIPYTVNIIGSGRSVSQITSVDGSFYDMLLEGFGSVGFPTIFQGNGQEALNTIYAALNEYSHFSAKTATGDVTVTARWVPDNQGKVMARASGSVLSSDNPTAVYENGVLTFTGSGIINFAPDMIGTGTLIIETSDGITTEYKVHMVSPHTCQGSHWQTLISPEEGQAGYSVLCCDTCKKILSIRESGLCEEHNFSEEIKELEPTCENSGLMSKMCTVCGYKEYTEIPMLSHTSSQWQIEKEATPFEEGVKKIVCTVCGTELQRETIPVQTVGNGITADIGKGQITGIPQGMTSEQLKELYKGLGYEVTVDAQGEEIQTGDKLIWNENSYYLVLKGEEEELVQVDIKWGDMKFTYKDTWNPETHQYDNGIWTVNEDGGNQITVSNTGKLPVDVQCSYEQRSDDISGTLTDENNASLEGSVLLEPNILKKMYFMPEGTPTEAMQNETIGTIKLVIGG